MDATQSTVEALGSGEGLGAKEEAFGNEGENPSGWV